MTWVVLFWIVDVAKGARIFLFASHDDMNALVYGRPVTS
jgi:hypothetical protein